MIRILILGLCCGIISGKGMDLPSYIPRCSISDPNLNDCIKNNANKAIPFIAKGDYEFEIPSISPVSVREAPVKGYNLEVIVNDVYGDDFKNLRLVKVTFDLKNRKATMLATVDRLQVIGKNYTVISGEFLGVKASGHGLYNFTIINATFDYKADIRTYQKEGETYLEMLNSTMVTDCERGYYFFGNLTSDSISDMNAYIDQNWRKFRNQLKPVVNMYLTAFVHLPFSVITSKVPMNKIFLP